MGVCSEGAPDLVVAVLRDEEVVEGTADALQTTDDGGDSGHDGADGDRRTEAGGGAFAGYTGQHQGSTRSDTEDAADQVAHIAEVADPVVLCERACVGPGGVEGQLQAVGPQDDGVVDHDTGVEEAAVIAVHKDGDAVEIDVTGHLVLVETGIADERGRRVGLEHEVGGLDGGAVGRASSST